MFSAAAQARGFPVSGRACRGREQRVQRERLAVRPDGLRQARALAAAAMAAAARPRPRPRRQVLPAGVRGACRPAAARLPGLLPAAADMSSAPALRVPAAAAAATAALVGRAGVRRAAATDARSLRPDEARAVPQSVGGRAVVGGATRGVQPLHEQGARDPLAGVPAERAATAAGGGEAAQVPQPAEQDAGARAPVRLPGGRLRPPLLALGRADATHPHPHRPEAVPVSDLHALLQPLGPPDDPRPDAHGREAVRLRRVRPQVRALRREEAAREGAPQAAIEARARRWRAPLASPRAALALSVARDSETKDY